MGAGDFITGLPLIRLLKSLGVRTVYLGNLAVQWWEKEGYFALAPDVYTMDEIYGAERLSSTVALMRKDTTLKSKLYDGKPPEAVIADLIGAPALIATLESGARGLAEGLDEACVKLGLDLLVAVDCGGDVLMTSQGSLKPLTPLHDLLTIAALTRMKVRSVLALTGYACDGEVSIRELDREVAALMKRGGYLGAWGVTKEDTELLDKAFQIHPDPIDELVVKAVRGQFGEQRVLGSRIVDVTPMAGVVLFFDPRVVSEVGPASALANTRSLKEAEEILVGLGLTPETYMPYYMPMSKYGDST